MDALTTFHDHFDACPLIAIVGNEQRFRSSYDEANEETVPTYLTFDPNNPNSIVSCVARSREQARSRQTAPAGAV